MIWPNMLNQVAIEFGEPSIFCTAEEPGSAAVMTGWHSLPGYSEIELFASLD